MNKLFLTSSGITKDLQKSFLTLLNKNTSFSKVAFIPTAADPQSEKERWHIQKSKTQLKDIGLSVYDVDLKNQTEQSLYALLSPADIIFVNGGETIYLLQKTQETHFDRVIKTLLKTGKAYVGVSAGTYLVCPSIAMAYWKTVEGNDIGNRDFNGMNLVPFYTFVHYENKYLPIVKNHLDELDKPIYLLRDGQAIRCVGNTYDFMGKGEHLILEQKH